MKNVGCSSERDGVVDKKVEILERKWTKCAFHPCWVLPSSNIGNI